MGGLGTIRGVVLSPDPDRLPLEDVTLRSFSFAKRGYDTREVRDFLEVVAEELRVARAQADEMAVQAARAEERLARAGRLDEDQLVAMLGQETARVLEAARAAAEGIRARAGEEAAAVVRRAEAAAEMIRADADRAAAGQMALADVRVAERLQAAAEAMTEARDEAAAVVARAGEDAAATLEDARQQGRAMVDEARAVRERMLRDLTRRRRDLRHQLDALDLARHRVAAALAAAGAVADAASGDLAEVGPDAVRAAGAAPGAVAAAARGIDDDVLDALDALRSERAAAGEPHLSDDVLAAIAEGAGGGSDPGGDEASSPPPVDGDGDARVDEPGTDDVGALGDRPEGLSAAAPEDPGAARALDEATDGGDGDGHQVPTAAAGDLFDRLRREANPRRVAGAGEGPSDDGAVVVAAGGDDPDASRDPLLAERDRTTGELARTLARRLKRSLADEENGLLVALRRHDGPLAVDRLLPARDGHHRRLADAALPTLAAAAAAGVATAHGEWPQWILDGSDTRVGDLAERLADDLVDPLREGIVGTETAAGLDDAVENVRAAYRQVGRRDVDRLAARAVRAAHQRGLLAALRPEASLGWRCEPGDSAPAATPGSTLGGTDVDSVVAWVADGGRALLAPEPAGAVAAPV